MKKMDKIEKTPLEIWRPVVGYGGVYEGRYEVSNLGRVKSLDSVRVGRVRNIYSKPERILVPLKQRQGYLQVHLVGSDGSHKHKMIHCLVAQAFIPNPDNLPQINHKDENKANNLVWVNEDGTIEQEKSNIEWCTRSYNINYGSRNAIVSEKNRAVKGIPILQFTKAGEFVREWKSAKDAARELGGNNSAIGNCIAGRLKTSCGFIWKKK